MNYRVAFGCKGDRSTPVAGVLRLGEGPPQVLSIWPFGLKTFAILVNENNIRFSIRAITVICSLPLARSISSHFNVCNMISKVIYMRTRDNDPVISLHLSNSYLTLGDVNGELHRLEVS